MEFGFDRLAGDEAAPIATNALDYGRLVAGLDALQAASHVAAVEQSIASGRFAPMPHVGAMTSLFAAEGDWAYAAANLEGSFHSEMAKHLNDLRE